MEKTTVGYTESEEFKCLEDLEQLYPLSTVSPLFLAYCGKEKCAPDKSFGPYIRDNYVIHVVVDGKGTYVTGGCEYTLGEGQAFVIYPGEETFYKADHEDPWTYVWVGFNGYQAEMAVEAIGFTHDVPVASFSDTANISSCIDAVLEARELTLSNNMKRYSAFYALLGNMIELNDREADTLSYHEARYVNMAVEFMIASYSSKLKISEVADRLGINRSYLSTLFKREMHMSPQEFLVNFRLGKAAQMLTETKSPIVDIAAAVGYSDSLAFSKAFKRKYNVSPSAFRTMRPELLNNDHHGDYKRNFRL